MRPLILTQNITLDGSVEMLDDWFDPMAADDEMGEVTARDSADCDTILLGRRTFEDFRGFWPEQDDDTTGISAELDALRKVVVSRTLGDPGWVNSTVISTDPVAAVRELKAADGGEISLTGSIELSHLLLGVGLVDEIRLWTFPVTQGRGRRLVPEGHRQRFTLREHLAFPSSVTYTRWTLGGTP
ncbi:dihydrofolate reductase family protein [Brachybacterium squillarum]|uniref:dihydrofolate reductase family protein n=1 Tax=Brachybacterium squillarum TaxID=661979 RepID=UPI0002629863|nr:dihydrofolate reductase family protein [Brachybacterium squillarum]